MPSYWFDHIHLVSPDALKTAEFYEKTFSARRVAVRELSGGRVSVSLDLNGSQILIAQAAPGAALERTSGGLEHFGIRTDDIEATVASLKANGVKFRNEIFELRPGVRICFFWAPDDVLIELLEIKPRG